MGVESTRIIRGIFEAADLAVDHLVQEYELS